MEIFFKALLKCSLPLRICEAHLKPVLWACKVHPALGKAYSKFFLWNVTKQEKEQKLLYARARIYIGYDGALEGGRDQDWWFKLCDARMAETIEYWTGETPKRVAYNLAMGSPLEFPNTFVRYTVLRNFFIARHFITTNKWWLGVISFLTLSHLL